MVRLGWKSKEFLVGPVGGCMWSDHVTRSIPKCDVAHSGNLFDILKCYSASALLTLWSSPLNELTQKSQPRRPQSPELWIFGEQTHTSAARLRQHRRATDAHRIGHKIATLKVKSNVDQSDECRNLD